MHRFLVVITALALGLAPASVAQAQLNPQFPPELVQPPPPPPPPAETFDDGGLSTLQVVLIFGSAALVLGGVGYVIVRDARRRAPVAERPRAHGKSSSQGGGSATAKAVAGEARRAPPGRASASAPGAPRRRPSPCASSASETVRASANAAAA